MDSQEEGVHDVFGGPERLKTQIVSPKQFEKYRSLFLQLEHSDVYFEYLLPLLLPYRDTSGVSELSVIFQHNMAYVHMQNISRLGCSAYKPALIWALHQHRLIFPMLSRQKDFLTESLLLCFSQESADSKIELLTGSVCVVCWNA
jgi:hypothetical protein